MKPGSILCFGEALWDMPPGQRMPGGAPMNVAARLARAGLHVHMLSRVGRDDLGDELIAYMAAQGLTTGYVQQDDRYPTGTVIVDSSDPEDVRYEITGPVAWDFIDAGPYIEDSGGSCDVVVFGSLAARNEVSRESILQLLKTATTRIFDVNIRPPFAGREILEALLGNSDWVKLNESELDEIVQWHDPAATGEAAMRALQQRYDLEAVCVTRGSDGAELLYQSRWYRQAAFDVAVVDTVGCGDAFLGSWLSGMLSGSLPRDALRRAAAVAAIVASSKGANPEITEADVQAMMTNRQRLDR